MNKVYDPYTVWNYSKGMPFYGEVHNPIGQPLQLTWQEDGKIQYHVCKDYEEAEKLYEEYWGKPYLKLVKSVVLSYGEVGVLADADRVRREVAEAKLAHEKKVKEEKEADMEEYRRLQNKLYPGATGAWADSNKAF